jgi:hypothetical protein
MASPLSSSLDPVLSRLPSASASGPAAAAALRLSPGPSAPRASVFDLLVLDRFSAMLKPAFDRAFQSVFLAHFPTLGGLAPWRDELWMGLLFTIQEGYLRAGGTGDAGSGKGGGGGAGESVAARSGGGMNGALLEEAMYGWRRVHAPNRRVGRPVGAGVGGRLSERAVIFSLLLHVVAPYLRSKTAQWAAERAERARAREDRDRGEDADAPFSRGEGGRRTDRGARDARRGAGAETAVGRIRAGLDTFARVFPSLSAGFDVVSLGYYAAYGLGLSRFASPALHLLGIELVRAGAGGEGGARARDGGGKEGPEVASGGAGAGASPAPPSPLRAFATTLKVSVVILLVMLKVAQLWGVAAPGGAPSSSSSAAAQRMAARAWQAVPPPPRRPLPAVEPPGPGCPICGAEPPARPTASPSGFVFCEDCIVSRIRRQQEDAGRGGQGQGEYGAEGLGTCPLTGESCKVEDLRRLYEY